MAFFDVKTDGTARDTRETGSWRNRRFVGTLANKATRVAIFDGMLDHVNAVVAHNDNPRNRNVHPFNSGSWVGRYFSDWKDCAKAASSAWPEGVARVQAMASQINDKDLPEPKSIRRRPRWNEDDGDEIDLDRLRVGQPYWRQTRRESVTGPHSITVAVQVGANCGRTSDELFWRGAAALVLAERLEQAGYMVELWGYSYAAEVFIDRSNVFQAFRIKDSSDYLEINTLASALAGWYFRTIMFGGYWLYPNTRPAEGYGFQSVVPRSLLSYLSRTPEQVIVMESCWDLKQSLALIRHVLTELIDGPKALGGFAEANG